MRVATMFPSQAILTAMGVAIVMLFGIRIVKVLFAIGAAWLAAN